jgi:hypothetical protein
MARQLENERNLIGDATTKTLLKEMWLIPANRKRTFITIMLMIWQQMTGVNAIVCRRPQYPPEPETDTHIELLRPANLPGPGHEGHVGAALCYRRLRHR